MLHAIFSLRSTSVADFSHYALDENLTDAEVPLGSSPRSKRFRELNEIRSALRFHRLITQKSLARKTIDIFQHSPTEWEWKKFFFADKQQQKINLPWKIFFFHFIQEESF